MVGNRTFIDEMDRDSDGLFVAGEQFEISPGDTGEAYRSHTKISSRTPASIPRGISPRQANVFSDSGLARELDYKEGLLTMREYEIYRENNEYFPTASEKIFYLDLTRNEKADYLRTLKGRSSKHSPFGAELVNSEQTNRPFISSSENENDFLSLGMSKNNVINMWGRPSKVEVAGLEKFENERWSFYGNEGLTIVYFEAGEVNGWSLP